MIRRKIEKKEKKKKKKGWKSLWLHDLQQMIMIRLS